MQRCRIEFGDRVLRLTPEQVSFIAESGLAVKGFFFDCDLGVSGDVLLEDGRWLKMDGALHGVAAVDLA